MTTDTADRASNETNDTIGQVAIAGVGLVVATTLAGCGGGGGGGGGSSAVPANTITKLTIKDAAANPVTVSSVTGTPNVTFTLDGSGAATSKPRDPGAEGSAQDYAFAVSGTGGSANVGITINPLPETVSTVANAALKNARRTVGAMGFAPSWDELMGYLPLTHAQRVEAMLARISGTPAESYPSWIDEPILTGPEQQAMTKAQQDAYRTLKGNRRTEFKAWWYRQMVTSPDPLSERLLLFWHNVFTTAATDVDQPALIARQHRLYRQNIGGNLRTFLKAMSRDPAMVMYLDSALSIKGRPNENFARELMELFTLGELSAYHGYAESDIPIVARCFTGYGLTNRLEYQFDPSSHDYDPKTLWGHVFSGSDDAAVSGDTVIDLILQRTDGSGHSVCAHYLVTRLWKEFIGEIQAGDDTTILALADQFSGAFDWDLKSIYRAVFTTAAFTDAARRGSRVRSPVELYAGYFRALEFPPNKWDENLNAFSFLEQNLLDPPSVFGWKGGRDWITVKTLVDRRAFVSGTAYNYRPKVPARLLRVLDVLLMSIDPVVPPTDATNAGNRALQYVSDPAYNLH